MSNPQDNNPYFVWSAVAKLQNGKIYKAPVSSPHGHSVLNDGTVLWAGRILGIHNHIQTHAIHTDTGEMTLRRKMELYKCDEFKDIYFYEPHAVQLADGRIINPQMHILHILYGHFIFYMIK